MITSKFTTTFTLKRTTWSEVLINGKTIKKTVEADGDSFLGYIQQADAEYAQYNNLTTTKGYSVWCAIGTGVAEGDTIYNDNIAYEVRAKQTFIDGCNPHIQLAVELIGQHGV